MRIDIMTLFPDTIGDILSESILGRGQERGFIRIECHQIRDYTTNKQNQVDDVLTAAAVAASCRRSRFMTAGSIFCDDAGFRIHTIFMSPCGKVFRQEDAIRLRNDYDRLILVCGHYEGIDERFISLCVDEEISIGDFVLTGGEIPAMAVADAVCRLVPGVLPDEECFQNESHWNGLRYPQYSRPEIWNGLKVPDILLSGHHANIAKWRRKQSIIRTRTRRPDMYEKVAFTDKKDIKILKEIENETSIDEN